MISLRSDRLEAPQATASLADGRRLRTGTVHHAPMEDAAGTGPTEESEAFRELLSRADRRTGSIPAALLVKHLLRVTGEADWPVQLEAWNALQRRLEFARRDELKIASRPGAAFGFYTTRRSRSAARPYTTLLESLDPLRASCDCPDFLRSSLGVCKHALTVLEDLAQTPRKLAAALRGDASLNGSGPRLVWDPVRPLTGRGDPLERIQWRGSAASNGRGSERSRLAQRWFHSAGVSGGDLSLRDVFATDPARRLALVTDLLAFAGGNGVAEPAARALLRLEKERLEREADLRLAPGQIRGPLAKLKRDLYPYQREGVENFLAAGRLLLADDMGLGKTAQAIASCHILWHLDKVRRGLLIVPASLKPQWLREWQLFSDAPAAVVDGHAAERAAAYRAARKGFLIVNYEQVLRDLEVIQGWKPDLVVLDEAQRIKNWATKTAACVKTLDVPYRLVLTGTPMENRLEELASILDWVDDLALEPKWRLVPWHTQVADGKKEIAGARNLNTLRVRLEGRMVRRVRQEVLRQLPPRTDTRVPVEMTPEQLEEHSALDQPIASILRRAKTRPLTQAEFLRLMSLLTTQRIISNGLAQLRFEETWPDIARVERPGEALLQSLASPKLIELRRLVEQVVVEQGRKMVVFSQWRRMLRLADWALRDLLSDAGLRAVFFTGEEGQKRRTQNVVDFNDDPATRIFFASDAGGVGLNLQRAANSCVNLELPWNPAVLEQRIGRIYRLGQKSPIDVYNLVSERGIEARISSLVDTKRALFKGLFDGTSDAVKFDGAGGFLSRIEKLVEPAPALEGAKPGEERSGDLEDMAVEKEIEAVLVAADESRVEAAPERSSPAVLPAAAAENRGTTARSDAPAVGDLFSRIEVRRRPSGALVIEAPPDAAANLAALLEGFAGLLRQAGR